MTRRVPATVVQLGTVLDLTTQDGERRTTWEHVDVGGMFLCSGASAMEHSPGRAALYLLRPPPREPNARRGAKEKTGYTDCACRDCFDVAIGKAGEAMCSECEAAGCSGDGECERSDAYGVEDDSRTENRPRTHEKPSRGARATRARRNPEHADAAADTYEAWHRREPECVREVDGLPDDLPHYIGRALRIGYRSDKWHGRGTTEDYDHDYTEAGYTAPGVWADDPDLAKARAICIRGGNQRITPQGID
jgi:hypothetical protein